MRVYSLNQNVDFKRDRHAKALKSHLSTCDFADLKRLHDECGKKAAEWELIQGMVIEEIVSRGMGVKDGQ